MTSNADVRMVLESKIPRETYRFTWSIADFPEVKNSTEMANALSVTLDMGQSIGMPVTFRAYLKVSNKEEDEGWIGWYLELVKTPPDVKEVMAKTAITIGSYRDLADKEALKFTVDSDSKSWGWSDVIRQSDDDFGLPVDLFGRLPIEITVTLYNTEGTKFTVTDLMAQFQPKFSRKLSEDMERMTSLLPGIPGIVSVVARDGQEFPANSSSLAARSPVFRLMFQMPRAEVKEGVVKMEDIGGEALEVFLHFVHTATLKDNWKETGVLEELVCAAHKYLMQDLLDFLDEALGLVCPPENCANLIRVAHRRGLPKATEALLKMYRDQWKQLTDVDKMMELFPK